MTPPNTASGGGSGVIALVLILAVVAGVAYYVAVVRGAKQSITTPWQPSQVLRQAVQEIGAERKWVVTGHTQDYATFTRAGTKSCALGCLLLWLFFIPGVLYLVFAGKSQVLTVSVFRELDGTTTVQLSASGGQAAARGRRFLQHIPHAVPQVDAQRPQVAWAAAGASPSPQPAAPGFPARPPLARSTMTAPPVWSGTPSAGSQPAGASRGPAPTAYLPMVPAPPPPPPAPPRAAGPQLPAAPPVAAWPTASPPAWSGTPSAVSQPVGGPRGPAPTAYLPMVPAPPPPPPAPPRAAGPQLPAAPPVAAWPTASPPAWSGTPSAAGPLPRDPRRPAPASYPQVTSAPPPPPPPPPPLPAAPTVPTAPRVCPRCHSVISVPSPFCPQCGTGLQGGIP
jgi:hypothetical protein